MYELVRLRLTRSNVARVERLVVGTHLTPPCWRTRLHMPCFPLCRHELARCPDPSGKRNDARGAPEDLMAEKLRSEQRGAECAVRRSCYRSGGSRRGTLGSTPDQRAVSGR